MLKLKKKRNSKLSTYFSCKTWHMNKRVGSVLTQKSIYFIYLK